eukprot:15353002-Ditylum_brightwellii.AAC.2
MLKVRIRKFPGSYTGFSWGPVVPRKISWFVAALRVRISKDAYDAQDVTGKHCDVLCCQQEEVGPSLGCGT